MSCVNCPPYRVERLVQNQHDMFCEAFLISRKVHKFRPNLLPFLFSVYDLYSCLILVEISIDNPILLSNTPYFLAGYCVEGKDRKLY